LTDNIAAVVGYCMQLKTPVSSLCLIKTVAEKISTCKNFFINITFVLVSNEFYKYKFFVQTVQSDSGEH